MAKTTKPRKRPIEQYEHKGKKRVNNPPVGLVTPDTDPDLGKKAYAYNPHLDPQLTWAGKAEHTSFQVPTVSLHVHERIDPRVCMGVRLLQHQDREHRVRRRGQDRRLAPGYRLQRPKPLSSSGLLPYGGAGRRMGVARQEPQG
jgi:hypothetical protein